MADKLPKQAKSSAPAAPRIGAARPHVVTLQWFRLEPQRGFIDHRYLNAADEAARLLHGIDGAPVLGVLCDPPSWAHKADRKRITDELNELLTVDGSFLALTKVAISADGAVPGR